jgi:putative ABC transport system permease protein
MRLSGTLVIGEVAISMTLLAGAGLLLNSLWRLMHVNPGFQTQHVLTARISLEGPAYGDGQHREAFWRQFEQRVAALPGVEAVGATSELPLAGEHSDCPFYLDGRTYGPSEFDDANCRQVTPGYLAAMRIPLLAGRWLDEHDTAAAPGVVLVNQAFAKRFFHGQNVIGKGLQVLEGRGVPRMIVGVVGNISHSALRDPQQAEMYTPYAQLSPPDMCLVVRTASDPEGLAAALRTTTAAIDKNVALSRMRSMDDVREASVAQPRFSSQLLGLFAGLALLLAAIGLYGLMAYSVAQRTHELGIRVALGAKRSDMLRLVVGQGMGLTLAGVGIGIGGALVLARFLSNLLYGVKSTDAATFMEVTALLTAAALLACFIPAWRATRVDPMEALRHE